MDSIIELGNAIFSGYNAASVFGVTSAKINTTKARTTVANNSATSLDKPSSIDNLIAIMVAMEEAAILTKLLPIRINPISLSGRFSSLLTRLAP